MKQVGGTERPGVSWMTDRLRTAKTRAREEMLALDQELFACLHTRLERQLSSLRTTIPDRSDSRPRTTAAVTAGRVRRDSGRLQGRLRRIRGYSSEVEIHRARIAAKHLRYLLEPFASGLPEAGAVIERLKALQDSFGDVHDAQVFEKELLEARPEIQTSGVPALVPGVDALLAALRARGLHAFESASPAWLGPGAEPFFPQVDALADAIAALDHHAEEVERKFLLTGLPPIKGAEGPVEIEQGYLPGDRLVERLRRIHSDAGVELVRTVKEGSGLARLEVEEPVSPDGFAQLWPLTEGRRLRKRRYRIPDGELTWEIDQFLDRDLVLAEVEFSGQSADVRIPGWLLPYVDREVTEESAYSNVNLASSGANQD
jgi:CYTH domain-containing protein